MGISRISRMLGILKCESSSKSKDNWNNEANWNYRNIWNFQTLKKLCLHRPRGIMGISRILRMLGILKFDSSSKT